MSIFASYAQRIETVAERAALAAHASRRVLAIDLGRGWMMFLQIAHPFFLTGVLPLVAPPELQTFLIRHLEHSKWHGVNYLDLGLPGYIVAMGAALHLALQRARSNEKCGRDLLRPVLVRAALLFALGIVCNGGLREPWPDVRIAGVLQRLAICYLTGTLIGWYCRARTQALLVIALLLGYWALMAWVPFPGATADRYGGLVNLAAYVDAHYLPGRALYGSWDPEGILTTIPAVATCVAGLLFGRVFTASLLPKRRLQVLLAIGCAAIALGKLWATWFPINKYMWTSSFVLVTIGAISLHLLLFYVLADLLQLRRALLPLFIYGRHSLAAYISDQLIDFEWIALSLVGGSVALALGRASGLVLTVTVLLLQFSLLYWLERRGVPSELEPEDTAPTAQKRFKVGHSSDHERLVPAQRNTGSAPNALGSAPSSVTE
jgi:predicted acyltransferase